MYVLPIDFFSGRSEGSVCSRVLSTPRVIDTRYLFMTFTPSQLHHLLKILLDGQFLFVLIYLYIYILYIYFIESSIQGDLSM